MSDSKELTLQDLAKIGLGLQNFSETNIGVLHSLIDAILRKLNCYDEKVVISGLACEHLLELLRKSKTAPLTILTTKMPGLSRNTSDQLTLEERVETLEKTSNEGCDAKKNDSWDTPGIEDISFVNPFMKNIYEFLDDNIKDNLKEQVIRIEGKLDVLECLWEEIILRETQRLKQTPEVDNCYHHLSTVSIHHRKFKGAVDSAAWELQQIMDLKANNYEVLELKRDILQEFDQIDRLIQERKSEKIEFPALLYGMVAPKKHMYVEPKKSVCQCEGSGRNQSLYLA